MITDGDKIDGLADRLFTESLAFAGHLSDKEARFLAVLAACVPGEGVILEIGSYKGKSTIILSKAEAAATLSAARPVHHASAFPVPSTEPRLWKRRSCPGRTDDASGSADGTRPRIRSRSRLNPYAKTSVSRLTRHPGRRAPCA